MLCFLCVICARVQPSYTRRACVCVCRTKRMRAFVRAVCVLCGRVQPFNSHKSNCLGMARQLWESGYSVFMFDFRSFAEIPTKQSVGYYEQRVSTERHYSYYDF